RELRGYPRARTSGVAASDPDELPRAVGGNHERYADRSAAGVCVRPTIGNVMSQPSLVAGARFVDPKVLARIGNLELVSRSVVDGFINGLHRSPYFGASVDFAEHRG